MAKDTIRQKSIMIVGGTEQFNTIVKKAVSGENFTSIEIKRSAADIVVICSPLPDELGHQFALDICTSHSSSVLMIAPSEVTGDISEYVTNYGVMVMSKPVEYEMLKRALKYLIAIQERFHKARQREHELEGKLQELKIISRAKCLLIEKKGMNEAEAHRYIGKRAMDEGLTRKLVAEDIIDSMT